MKIKMKKIKICDVVEGYVNNQEEGVYAYGGKLNIRPPYQREFVYKDKQRDDVIRSIQKNFPLNVIYWTVNKDSETGEEYYEVLDGQQRLISICEYVHGTFALDYRYFHNLTQEEQEQILDYELMVYFCEGTDKEKLEWFEIINIAGEKLTKQELRNAVYTGKWLSDAKRYFSKRDCPAYDRAKEYMKGSPIRQDYLETVIKWISNDNIEEYMSQHQHDSNANELWLYFNSVITWVKTIFPTYRKEMKGIDWGFLYNQHKDKKVDANELEIQIKKLMLDDDVTNKKGIYAYVLDGDERHLNIRQFTEQQKREAYERQNGICAICGKHFDFEDMEADHIIAWSKGGKTISDNCQMLCKSCNRRKKDK